MMRRLRSVIACLAVGLMVHSLPAQGGRGGGTATAQAGGDEEWDDEDGKPCPKCDQERSVPIVGTFWHWFERGDTTSPGAGTKCAGIDTSDTRCHTGSKYGECDGGGNGKHESCSGNLAVRQEVKSALSVSDYASVFAVAARQPRVVGIVQSGYVLIRDCSGRVVSATRIPAAAIAIRRQMDKPPSTVVLLAKVASGRG